MAGNMAAVYGSLDHVRISEYAMIRASFTPLDLRCGKLNFIPRHVKLLSRLIVAADGDSLSAHTRWRTRKTTGSH